VLYANNLIIKLYQIILKDSIFHPENLLKQKRSVVIDFNEADQTIL